MANKQKTAIPARERIIQAATGLFSTALTVDAVTIESIAAQASISKATFYHYFRSKSALLEALDKTGFHVTEIRPGERRDEIMDAAVQLVAQQGLHATTMEQIAGAAGITKGALYWYFRDKNELFQSAIRRLSPLLRMLPSLEAQLDRPPEEVLRLVAKTYLSTFDNPDAVRFFRILLSEAPRMPEIATNFGRNAKPALDFIVRYLKYQIDIGRLRSHDAQTSARVFMGALMLYITSRELFPFLYTGLPDTEQYVRELVAIFLQGIGTGGEPGQ